MIFIVQHFLGPAMLWAMEHSVGNSTNCWMVLETKGSIRGIRIIGGMLDEGFSLWMYRTIHVTGGRERSGKTENRSSSPSPSNHHTITPSHHHTHHYHYHNQRHCHHHCRHHHHQRHRHRPQHPFLFKIWSEIAAPGRVALEALTARASYSVSQQAVGG